MPLDDTLAPYMAGLDLDTCIEPRAHGPVHHGGWPPHFQSNQRAALGQRAVERPGATQSATSRQLHS